MKPVVRRFLSVTLAVAALAVLPALAGAQAVPHAPRLDAAGRDLFPVVLLGEQLGPAMSYPASYAEVPPVPMSEESPDGQWVPVPGSGPLVEVDEVVGYRWTGKAFEQIPLQVDERFPRYLTNHQSEFGVYSQADLEMTYAFDVDGRKKEVHPDDPGFDPATNPARACEDPSDPTGMTAGLCDPSDPAQPDPLSGLDSDDEVAFMWRDAGAKRAPAGRSPAGADSLQEVRLLDPLTGAVRWVYIGRHVGGAPPTASYVTYQRDADADQFVKANRGGYGGSQGGGPCWSYDGLDAASNPDGPFSTAPVLVADCDHRRARDSATVTAQTYRFHYSGRWKMDSIQLSDGHGGWGPDLVDRWKGRAFQLREDVGLGASIAFEDETYWSLSSITLGERVGPVRVLRETWGADSGTPTTRLETFYAGHFEQLYHLRVHPIPTDGIYAFWDHNQGAVDTYYSALVPGGIQVDGRNDEALTCGPGKVSRTLGPVAAPLEDNALDPDCPGDNRLFLMDVPDPTVQAPLSNLAWDQVAGPSGSMVTTLEAVKTMQSGALTTYYRDDALFDDGTGDNPSPGLQKMGCDPEAETCQGSFGAHGVHFFFTSDTDNLFLPVPTTEFVARTAQYLLPALRKNVGESIAALDRAPVQAVAVRADVGQACAGLEVALKGHAPHADAVTRCTGSLPGPASQPAVGLPLQAPSLAAATRCLGAVPRDLLSCTLGQGSSHG